MKLAALQREIARVVMTPLTSADRMRRTAPSGKSQTAVAKRIIKPNDRLSSFERLEIYNRQYWFRVLDALADDFPGLRAILGDRKFDVLVRSYLTECPSRSFTMRNIGSQLESWLRKNQKYAAGRLELALDMVRLEWAEIETFDSASEPPVTAAALAGADPAKLRLRLQPYIRLLDLHYPVDDLLLAVKQDPPADIASNAMEERQKRKKVSAAARLKPSPVYLTIHRIDNTVYFRRLEKEEFAILSALQNGRTLERAVIAGFAGSKLPTQGRASHVAAWFENWSSMDWFVL